MTVTSYAKRIARIDRMLHAARNTVAELEAMRREVCAEARRAQASPTEVVAAVCASLGLVESAVMSGDRSPELVRARAVVHLALTRVRMTPTAIAEFMCCDRTTVRYGVEMAERLIVGGGRYSAALAAGVEVWGVAPVVAPAPASGTADAHASC